MPVSVKNPKRPLAHATLCAALAALLLSCSGEAPAGRRYVATIQPVAAILSELAGGRAEVLRLMPPGASPHSYAPKPSDARQCESAAALFYVEEHFDGWLAGLAPGAAHSLLEMLPEDRKAVLAASDSRAEHGGALNPHIWTDPENIKDLLQPLTALLCALDPEGRPAYLKNSRRFLAELQDLEEKLDEELEAHRGKAVLLMHPSWNYFLLRYGIRIAGIVAPAPGKAPTAKSMKALIEAARAADARVVITEPQLPKRPAQLLAESTGVKLVEMDPIGGGPGQETYAAWLLYNARALAGALE